MCVCKWVGRKSYMHIHTYIHTHTHTGKSSTHYNNLRGNRRRGGIDTRHVKEEKEKEEEEEEGEGVGVGVCVCVSEGGSVGWWRSCGGGRRHVHVLLLLMWLLGR
jgi:hypothetical protein